MKVDAGDAADADQCDQCPLDQLYPVSEGDVKTRKAAANDITVTI